MSAGRAPGRGSSAHRTGLRGEAVAAAAARARGWTIAAQRLRTPAGEADVFATRIQRASGRAAHAAETRRDGGVRVGLIIEVKAARGRWPSADLVDGRRQARLWRVAEFLGHERRLDELEVVVALVRLTPNRESLRWIPLEAW